MTELAFYRNRLATAEGGLETLRHRYLTEITRNSSGVVSNYSGELWDMWLTNQGAEGGTVRDKWVDFLTRKGYTGNFYEMLGQYFSDESYDAFAEFGDYIYKGDFRRPGTIAYTESSGSYLLDTVAGADISQLSLMISTGSFKPTWVPEEGVLRFDNNDLLLRADTPLLDFDENDAFTMGFVLKLPSTSGSVRAIAAKDNFDDTSYYLDLFNGDMRLAVGNSGSATDVLDVDALHGEWVTIIFYGDGTNAGVIVNDLESTERPYDTITNNADLPYFFSRSGGNNLNSDAMFVIVYDDYIGDENIEAFKTLLTNIKPLQ